MARNHIMLDLETLDVTVNAAVIAIGAVTFDPTENDNLRIYERGGLFYANVKVEKGFDVSHATLKFWMESEETDKARKLLFSNPEPISLDHALHLFSKWVKEVGGEYIWSHGATYDIPVLINAYEKKGKPWPFSLRAARDTRTLNDISGYLPKNAARYGTEHHALDDAISQALMVQAAYAKLRGV